MGTGKNRYWESFRVGFSLTVIAGVIFMALIGIAKLFN